MESVAVPVPLDLVVLRGKSCNKYSKVDLLSRCGIILSGTWIPNLILGELLCTKSRWLERGEKWMIISAHM